MSKHCCIHGESLFPEQPWEQPQHEFPYLEICSVQPLSLTMQETQQVKSLWVSDFTLASADLILITPPLSSACLRMRDKKAVATQWKAPLPLIHLLPPMATILIVTLTTATFHRYLPWSHHRLHLQHKARAFAAWGQWWFHQWQTAILKGQRDLLREQVSGSGFILSSVAFPYEWSLVSNTNRCSQDNVVYIILTTPSQNMSFIFALYGSSRGLLPPSGSRTD